MARMLYQTDSSPFCTRMVKRHIRLCSQTPGCDQLPTTIKPALKELEAKRTASEAADEECSYTLDSIYLRARELDDGVRTVFRSAQNYDESHIGARTLIAIFPSEKMTDFTGISYEKKPAEATTIIARIEHLGSTHSLYPQADILNKKMAALLIAISGNKDAHDEYTVAQTQEEIARTDLRKAYETNYLEGRKLLGTKDVDKIFPVNKQSEEDEDEKGEDSGSKPDDSTKS
jgi:hypothetical protein